MIMVKMTPEDEVQRKSLYIWCKPSTTFGEMAREILSPDLSVIWDGNMRHWCAFFSNHNLEDPQRLKYYLHQDTLLAVESSTKMCFS